MTIIKREPKRAIATVKIGSKGQIVIPKEMRDMFGFKSNTTIVLLADEEKGIALHSLDVIDPRLEGLI